ncbi:MAG: hypothetical protein GWO04_40845 [Actinobacteria bacterium]|nr:hypothetical protein [Actinomycetota bacterium]
MGFVDDGGQDRERRFDALLRIETSTGRSLEDEPLHQMGTRRDTRLRDAKRSNGSLADVRVAVVESCDRVGRVEQQHVRHVAGPVEHPAAERIPVVVEHDVVGSATMRGCRAGAISTRFSGNARLWPSPMRFSRCQRPCPGGQRKRQYAKPSCSNSTRWTSVCNAGSLTSVRLPRIVRRSPSRVSEGPQSPVEGQT